MKKIRWSEAAPFLLIPLALVLAGLALVGQESELMLRSQEINLWLPTTAFWESLSQYPGWGVTWLSCYLTQFFYHPWLGTTLMVLLWLGITVLLVRAYHLNGAWRLLPLLVCAALMAAYVQTGYWVYFQKLPGHMMVPSVGLFLATLALWVASLIRNRWLHLGWTIVVGLLAYPLMGMWGLGATILAGTQHLTRGQRPKAADALAPLVALLLVVVVPRICYQHFFVAANADYLYVAAMPSMRVAMESFDVYRHPYYAMALAVVLSFAASFLPMRNRRGAILSWGLAAALLIVAHLSVKHVWYHDTNFQKEMAMNRLVDEGRWEEVLAVARDGRSDVKPTRLMVCYKNIAIFRLGRAGNEMYHYPEGSTPQNAPWKMHLPQVGGKHLYYQFGKANFCYRWCMEDGVEYGWSIETLKLMARTSLLNREWAVARKYLNLLRRTTFHRAWAERYAAVLDHPEAMDLRTLETSIQEGKPLLNERLTNEFVPIMHLMNYRDRLDGDNGLVEMYLLSTFSHGNGTDPYFQELTLIAALQMKDIDLFWPRFRTYAQMHPNDPMPLHYQEAAYLYGHLENKVNITQMPFSPTVVDTYKRFMDFNTKCGAMSDEQKAVAFYPQFGHTFYYFYFLVRGQKTN